MGTTLGGRTPSEEAHEPLLRVPPAVVLPILAFVAVHIGSQFLSDADFEFLIDTFALTPARFEYFGWYALGSGREALMAYVPFLSYGFLHSDFYHLTFNALGFLIFGTLVARRAGLMRFVALTLIVTVLAAATHIVTHWGSPVAALGASGAVSGLMGASFRFIFIHSSSSAVWPPERLPLFSRPVLLTSAVWILLNIVLGVTGFTPEGFGRMIAWEAHIGGFLSGLLLLPVFDRRRSWLS